MPDFKADAFVSNFKYSSKQLQRIHDKLPLGEFDKIRSSSLNRSEDMFQTWFLQFDRETKKAVADIETHQNTVLVITMLMIIIHMLITCIMCRLYQYNIAIETSLEVQNDRAEVYEKVISNINHEMKGFINRINIVVDCWTSFVPTNVSNDMWNMMKHLGFCLTTIDTRCSSFSNKQILTRKIGVDLEHICSVLQTMLPSIKVMLNSNKSIIGDPAFLYCILYQICRNACIHGVSPVILTYNGTSISVVNNAGRTNEMLSKLTYEEALELCMSGSVGTIVSSGRGLKDTISYCCKSIRVCVVQ